MISTRPLQSQQLTPTIRFAYTIAGGLMMIPLSFSSIPSARAIMLEPIAESGVVVAISTNRSAYFLESSSPNQPVTTPLPDDFSDETPWWLWGLGSGISLGILWIAIRNHRASDTETDSIDSVHMGDRTSRYQRIPTSHYRPQLPQNDNCELGIPSLKGKRKVHRDSAQHPKKQKSRHHRDHEDHEIAEYFLENQTSSSSDYSTSDYSTSDYSTNDYSTNDYSTNDYSTNDYSSSNCSGSDYSSSDYGSSGGGDCGSSSYGNGGE